MIRIAAGVCSRSTATRGVFCRGFASSTSGFLQLERCDSGVCIVKMNKKPVNTFDIAMMNEFASTIETLENDPGVSSLVLTSAFDGIFCAGLDLKYLHKPTEAEFTEFWSTFEGMWAKYYTTSLSTVALINGTSPALGAVLSLASDYRVMVKATNMFGPGAAGATQVITVAATSSSGDPRRRCILTQGPNYYTLHEVIMKYTIEY